MEFFLKAPQSARATARFWPTSIDPLEYSTWPRQRCQYPGGYDRPIQEIEILGQSWRYASAGAGSKDGKGRVDIKVDSHFG